MDSRLAMPLVMAAVALGLAFAPSSVRRPSSEPNPRPPPPVASSSAPSEPPCPEAVAALVPVQAARLRDWRVVRVSCDTARKVDVELTRGESRTVLTVAAAGVLPYSPPKTVGSLSIFYSHRHAPPDQAETDALLEALAEHVRAAKSPW